MKRPLMRRPDLRQGGASVYHKRQPVSRSSFLLAVGGLGSKGATSKPERFSSEVNRPARTILHETGTPKPLSDVKIVDHLHRGPLARE